MKSCRKDEEEKRPAASFVDQRFRESSPRSQRVLVVVQEALGSYSRENTPLRLQLCFGPSSFLPPLRISTMAAVEPPQEHTRLNS
jgi:hypothetical protein